MLRLFKSKDKIDLSIILSQHLNEPDCFLGIFSTTTIIYLPTSMKIGIAADHGGFELKEKLKLQIEKLGFELTDFGAEAYEANDDYPDFAIPLAKAVGAKKIERGIVLCGSGVGACFTVNKVKGVRAALLTETYSAHQGVEHDDMNIICIGGRVVGDQLAWEIVQAFLRANYSGEERHERRLEKVKELEKEQ